MTRKVALGPALGFALAVLAITGPARADSYVYSAQKREIKVCILLLDSFHVRDVNGNGRPDYSELENADPHTFYILDARTDIKPRGWELVNPLAPRKVTQRIKDRWDLLDPVHRYEVGQTVTKNMACYWEVYLTEASLEDLLQFDLVFLTSHMSALQPGPTVNNVRFTREDREKLRKLVDMGGTLWIEDCWLMRIEPDPAHAFFLNLNFAGTSLSGYMFRPQYSGIVVDRLHPIMNSPFRLTDEEINRLGDKNVDDYRLTDLFGTGLPDPLLSPIVNNSGDFGQGAGNSPYVAGGRYGSGIVLATAGDSACDINDWIKEGWAYTQTALNRDRPDRNGGAYCGTDIWRAPSEDLKFVYNVLNWAQGESNYRKEPRRTAFTREELTAPLDISWRIPLPANVRVSSAPAIWRSVAFFGTDLDAGGNAYIYAVDTHPWDDLDGDGNPNDGMPEGLPGIQDLTPASPYDVVWRYGPLNSRPSSMFVATVTEPVNGLPRPVDGLFFTTADGFLHCLRALPTASTGQILSQTAPLWGAVNVAPAGGTVSAPVVSRYRAYVLSRALRQGQQGPEVAFYLSVVNAPNGASIHPPIDVGSQLVATPEEQARLLGSVLPPPAVGLIRNEQNGGSADVVYCALPTGRLAAIAIEVFGETLARVPLQPTQPLYQRLFRLQHFRPEFAPQTVRLIQYDANGAVVGQPAVDPAQTGQRPDPREIVLQTAIPEGHRVVADYMPDPDGPGGLTPPGTERGRRMTYAVVPGFVPAQTTPLTFAPVLSGAAVGTDDSTCLASGNGMVEAIAERGGGGLTAADPNQVLWRYHLGSYTPPPGWAPGPTPTPPPMYVPDANDSAVWVAARFSPALNGWVPLPPAVTDRMVYVAMNAYDRASLDPAANAAPALIEGAVFAFERRATFHIPLDVSLEGVVGVVDMVNPKTRLYQYCPEQAFPAMPQATQGWKEIRADLWALDRNRNRITIRSFGQDLRVCPTLPVWVDIDGLGVPAAPGQGRYASFLLSADTTDMAPGMGNVIWRFPNKGFYPPDPPAGDGGAAANPGKWLAGVASAPTVSGDVVYVGTGDGRLFALDADPRDGMRADATAHAYRIVDDGWLDAPWFRNQTLPTVWPPNPPQLPPAGLTVPADVLWVYPQAAPTLVAGADVPDGGSATSRLIAVPVNDRGTSGTVVGFSQPVYAIGDANRMAEVDHEGRALWVMHEAKSRIETLIPGQTQYGSTPVDIQVVQKSLNRPASATPLSADTLLIADTGNDRVIAVDRSGHVLWEATEFYDPFGLLQAGEFEIGLGYAGEQNMRVSRLSTPTDVVQWISNDVDAAGNVNPNVVVRHALIADAGNYRVIEIVDKFQPGAPGYLPREGSQNGRWYHVVVWASQTNVGHRDPWGRWQPAQKYRYTSVQPVEFATPGMATYTRRVLCAVSNFALYREGGQRRQRLGASLVILEGQAAPGAALSPLTRGYVLDDPSPNAEPGYVSMIGGAQGLRPMDRPVSIRRFRFKWGTAGEVWHDLYVDATGIYEWIVPVVQGDTWPKRLPVTGAGAQMAIDPAAIYSQFWRETYQLVMKEWETAEEARLSQVVGGPVNLRPDPANPNVDFEPASYQFEPGSVSLLRGGGWLVSNRLYDRALANMLAQVDRFDNQVNSLRGKRIQVFTLKSNPVNEPGSPGDYDPTEPFTFGFTKNPAKGPRLGRDSIDFLFGPQIRDLATGRDLGIDLVNPMFAVRTE